MQHMPRTIILIWGVTAKVETIAFANEGMNLAEYSLVFHPEGRT